MNRILKGDMVKVISGKDKGRTGKVLSVFPELRSLIVEGINIVKRNTKPSQNFQGGIVEKPALFNWSKVMPLDTDGNAVRVKIKIGKNNQKVRISSKTSKDFAVSKKEVNR